MKMSSKNELKAIAEQKLGCVLKKLYDLLKKLIHITFQ